MTTKTAAAKTAKNNDSAKMTVMVAPETKTPETTKSELSKSDSIRAWHAANPEGTATECAKALAAEGITVGSGHCQQVMFPKTKTASNKIDVAQIQVAAEFCRANEGDVDNAIASIEFVGSFISECGSPGKAKAALFAYRELAELIK